MEEEYRRLNRVGDKLEKRPKTKNDASASTRNIAIYMTIAVGMLPYIITYSSGRLGIFALFWRFGMRDVYTKLLFIDPIFFFMVLPFPFMNLVYIVWMVRLYQGKTTVRKVLIIGLLTAAPAIILEILNLLPALVDPTFPYGSISNYPTPLSILPGLLLLKLRPPKVLERKWLDKENTWSPSTLGVLRNAQPWEKAKECLWLWTLYRNDMALTRIRGGKLRTNSVFKASGAIVVILLVTVASTASGITGAPLPELSPSSAIQGSSLLGSIVAGNDEARIAVVKPIFTDTAYSSAFYTFYARYASSTEPFITTDLRYFNVTVKDGWRWSTRLADFLGSIKASLEGLSLGQSVALIDEINVTMGALFDEDRRVYDVVILGFTEYVTLEEYYYYKRFVETGGTLIILDACNFLAEVKYHPPTSPGEVGYLSLVKGHGWEFNGTHAWKSVFHRWPEENRNWIGSNYWRWWSGNHYDFFQANTSHPISTYIRNNYEQNVTTTYGAHEENKLENLTDTQVIGYWHFIDPDEAPEDPVVAYQHKYGNGSVFHTGIMASDVIDNEEFLQAFLVSAVRMGLSGEVGEWTFWEDSSFQSMTRIFYENGTHVAQDGCLSGVVSFYVNFSTSIIARNQRPYSLRSVHVRIYRQNSVFSSEPLTVDGSMLGETSLYWYIEVNTWDLFETEYVFEIGCRFTSLSNSSDHVNSTLIVTVHRVKNVPDELRNSLYVALGSLATILVLVCAYVVWNGRRKPSVG